MSEEFTYKDYISREGALEKYNAYQNRYAENMRESDKVIVSEVTEAITKSEDQRLKVLDIGCSTGNLLLHLKRHAPEADLFGGDLAKSSLEECRKNPNLEGVTFQEMNVLNLNTNHKYDIIIINAVLYLFTWEEYEQALGQVFQALRPGGRLINFEWMHPYAFQDIIIYETTVFHPEGIRISSRPIPKIEEKLKRVGFADAQFIPFEMPFDLEQPAYDEEVVSYTKQIQDGGRLTFRGALYQPWAHMIAHKE